MSICICCEASANPLEKAPSRWNWTTCGLPVSDPRSLKDTWKLSTCVTAEMCPLCSCANRPNATSRARVSHQQRSTVSTCVDDSTPNHACQCAFLELQSATLLSPKILDQRSHVDASLGFMEPVTDRRTRSFFTILELRPHNLFFLMRGRLVLAEELRNSGDRRIG